MTRYWAIRTDTRNNTDYIWRELKAGRLRQGWGYRGDQNLHEIARIRAEHGRLNEHQAVAWRGNRRLLSTERDAVSRGDFIVMPHLPGYGLWTIVRVTGSYRYAIDDGRSGANPDFGHILPVEMVSGAVPWKDPIVPDRLRHAMRFRQRMRNLDGLAQEVDDIAHAFRLGSRQ